MDTDSRILISGAGVAGLGSAIMLGRAGFRPVVIEKAPVIRADGYVISLSHASYHYAEQLGLLPAIRDRSTGIRESGYLDRRGRAMLELDFDHLFDGIDVVQIMRDDLQRILHEAAADLCEIRLATTITAIDDHGARSSVTFSDGRTEEYDVVIGADGLHSNVRGLSFPDADVRRLFLGLASSAYRLPNILGMRHRFENHMERNRYMCVYTTRDDDLACAFIWESDAREAPPPENRYAELCARFDGAPAVVQRVLDAFPRDETVYMDSADPDRHGSLERRQCGAARRRGALPHAAVGARRVVRVLGCLRARGRISDQTRTRHAAFASYEADAETRDRRDPAGDARSPRAGMCRARRRGTSRATAPCAGCRTRSINATSRTSIRKPEIARTHVVQPKRFVYTFDLEDHRPNPAMPRRYPEITRTLLSFFEARGIAGDRVRARARRARGARSRARDRARAVTRSAATPRAHVHFTRESPATGSSETAEDKARSRISRRAHPRLPGARVLADARERVGRGRDRCARFRLLVEPAAGA